MAWSSWLFCAEWLSLTNLDGVDCLILGLPSFSLIVVYGSRILLADSMRRLFYFFNTFCLASSTPLRVLEASSFCLTSVREIGFLAPNPFFLLSIFFIFLTSSSRHFWSSSINYCQNNGLLTFDVMFFEWSLLTQSPFLNCNRILQSYCIIVVNIHMNKAFRVKLYLILFYSFFFCFISDEQLNHKIHEEKAQK